MTIVWISQLRKLPKISCWMNTAREMIGEWNRWMTLKRFRAFESRITKANPQITKFDKNIHYLRPIPTAELLLIDNANEYQNPGY